MRTKKMLIAAMAVALLPLAVASRAEAATWSGSVQQSNPQPSATSNYTLTIGSGATTTGNAVKCLVIEFDTAADGTGGIPTGMAGGLASATLSGTFTSANLLSTFTKDSSGAASGILKFTHATGGTGSNGTIILTGVTNGSTPDSTFFVRYNTYNNTNCSSSPQDDLVAASIWTTGTTATITIEPSLTYTINSIGAAGSCNGVTTTDASTSTAVTLKPTLGANKVAGQRHDIATNASAGYALYMRESQLPTFASVNDINAVGNTYGSPGAFSAAGTEAWGFTTNDATLAGGTANRFTNPSANWAPITTSSPGDVIADSSAPVSGAGGQTQVCFQVGMGTATVAGTYTTNIIYTAVGNW